MKLLTEWEAQQLSEDELRDLIKEKTGKEIPRNIKKSVIVALVSNQLDAIAEKKVFHGKNPDEYDSADMRRYTDGDLCKMAREKYKFHIPKTIPRKYLEEMVQGKLKPEKLSRYYIKEIGRANMEMAAFFGAQIGLDKLKGARKLHKSAIEKRGEQLAKRFRMKKYAGSKYV